MLTLGKIGISKTSKLFIINLTILNSKSIISFVIDKEEL